MKLNNLLSCVLWIMLVSAPMLAQNATQKNATAAPAASGTQQVSSPDSGFLARHPRYLLQVMDELEVKFPFSPEMDQTVTVQPDGFVTLKEVDDVYVKGQSTPEVQAAIQKAYEKILREPVLTVTLKQFQAPFVIVTGEVVRPGKFDLKTNTTVSEAIGVAGGFTQQAKHSQVLLMRRINPNWVEVKPVNVKHMINARNLSEDVELQPGDMLYVPKNRISKVRQFMLFNPGVGLTAYTPNF